MATERTFDYEHLRTLIREHPEWGNRPLAVAVTEHERRVRDDPRYGPINAAAIASAIYRYKDTWAERGDRFTERRHDPKRKSQPFRNLPTASYHCYEIQALRTLATMERGEPVSEKRRAEAESVRRRLDRECAVIDVTGEGRVYIRRARPDELDAEGNPFTYTARHPGLTELEWKLLETSEARAEYSSRWLSPAAA